MSLISQVSFHFDVLCPELVYSFYSSLSGSDLFINFFRSLQLCFFFHFPLQLELSRAYAEPHPPTARSVILYTTVPPVVIALSQLVFARVINNRHIQSVSWMFFALVWILPLATYIRLQLWVPGGLWGSPSPRICSYHAAVRQSHNGEVSIENTASCIIANPLMFVYINCLYCIFFWHWKWWFYHFC